MEDMIGLLIYAGLGLFLLLLGWLAGWSAERRHFSSLARREQLLANVLVTDLRSFPGGADPAAGAQIVTAEVVIASDKLKTFLAGLRKIVGGELHSYNTLMERARREVLVRLMARARAMGYDAVCNVRLNSGDIGGAATARRRAMAMVGLVASGTAYLRTDHGQAQ